MGLAESALRNVDKRTARREHKPVYSAEIAKYRSTFSEAEHSGYLRGDDDRPLRVFVRKRPLSLRLRPCGVECSVLS